MSLRVSAVFGERRRATIVDLPAASSPKKSIRSCLSFSLCFFNIVYNPILSSDTLFGDVLKPSKPFLDGIDPAFHHTLIGKCLHSPGHSRQDCRLGPPRPLLRISFFSSFHRRVGAEKTAGMSPAANSSPDGLPPDIRSRLAKVDREYQTGELTQRGYELRRSRILNPIDMANFSLGPNVEGPGRVNTSVVPISLISRLIVER